MDNNKFIEQKLEIWKKTQRLYRLEGDQSSIRNVERISMKKIKLSTDVKI
jgi:hypothetical protein